jgi:transcriptional regulator with XRE-family HTH domain
VKDALLAYRDARGRWCSEGRRRLGEAASGQQEKVAEILEISQQAVSQLVSGQTRPLLDRAVRIELAYGIPCREWALAPNTSAACLKSDEGEFKFTASR